MGAPTSTTEAPGYTHLFTAGGATPSKTLEVGHTQLATPSYRRYLGVNFNDFSFSHVAARRGVGAGQRRGAKRVVAATSIDATPVATYTVTRFSQGNGLDQGRRHADRLRHRRRFQLHQFAGRRRDDPRRRADRRRRHGAGPAVRLDDRALVRSRDADHLADRLRRPDAGGAAVRLRASGRLEAAVRYAAGAAVGSEGADHRARRRRAADRLAGGERQHRRLRVAGNADQQRGGRPVPGQMHPADLAPA